MTSPVVADITVVIPCFRSAKYLEQSVVSALDQIGKSLRTEVVVVDDHNVDTPTLTALESVARRDRVRVVQNRGPRGSAAARNEGVRQARTEWIAFLDADDWWPQTSIQDRLSVLKYYPDAEWIGGDFIDVEYERLQSQLGRFGANRDNYPFLGQAYGASKRPLRLDHPLECFLQSPPTHTIVSLLRKGLFETVGGFDERLLRQQDYHLFMRLARVASFHFVPNIVAYYRHHPDNSTRSLTHTQHWRVRALEALGELPEFGQVREALREKIFNLHISNSREYRRVGSHVEGACSALKALRVRPTRALGWRTLAAALIGRR